VVDLLTTREIDKANMIAAFLAEQNSERKTIESKMSQQAREMLSDTDWETTPAVVVAHADWHPGVIGIVASRLVDAYARPTIVLASKAGAAIATGSGRSIPGFELHKALQACDSHLMAHGGHAMACGLKIDPANIDAFRTTLQAYAAEHFPRGVPAAPRLRIDGEIPLNALTKGLLADLDRLEPYGSGNPKPRFLAAGLQVVGEPRPMGKDGRHLNMQVRQGQTVIRAVGWNMAERKEELMAAGGACSLVFQPVVNTFNGFSRIELQIQDLQAGNEVSWS
jgi:single-stranded-DNA-specific exonuclease